MRFFAAESIFWEGHHSGPGFVLCVQDDGTIMDLVPETDMDSAQVQNFSGILVPGFINAHAHLELSYLKGRIPTGTGMTGFVRAIQRVRGDGTDAERQGAIELALAEMQATGTVGLADICNGPTTVVPKKRAESWLSTYSFVELFGMNPGQSEEIFGRGLDLVGQFQAGRASITLHAPYSMSRSLARLVAQYSHLHETPLSVHLLESLEEVSLFEALEGPFLDFFREIGATFDGHTATDPIDFLLPFLPVQASTLLVHCTELRRAQAHSLLDSHPNRFVVLCPRANTFIHGTTPPADMLAQWPDRICLGTDSLASNTDLSLVEEMKSLARAYPALPSETLIRWGTQNGAKALGWDLQLGQISPGKKPGVVLLSGMGANYSFQSETQATLILR